MPSLAQADCGGDRAPRSHIHFVILVIKHCNDCRLKSVEIEGPPRGCTRWESVTPKRSDDSPPEAFLSNKTSSRVTITYIIKSPSSIHSIWFKHGVIISPPPPLHPPLSSGYTSIAPDRVVTRNSCLLESGPRACCRSSRPEGNRPPLLLGGADGFNLLLNLIAGGPLPPSSLSPSVS